MLYEWADTVRAHLRYAGSGRGRRWGDSGLGACRRGDTRQLAPGYTWAWRCIYLSVYVCTCTCAYVQFFARVRISRIEFLGI